MAAKRPLGHDPALKQLTTHLYWIKAIGVGVLAIAAFEITQDIPRRMDEKIGPLSVGLASKLTSEEVRKITDPLDQRLSGIELQLAVLAAKQASNDGEKKAAVERVA